MSQETVDLMWAAGWAMLGAPARVGLALDGLGLTE